MKPMISITEEEILELSEDNVGICVECGEFSDFAEPDAENYHCECCGKNRVYGIEQALLCQLIDIA